MSSVSQQVIEMPSAATAMEQHFSVAQLAQRWSVSEDTIRRLFEHEGGVLVIEPPERLVDGQGVEVRGARVGLLGSETVEREHGKGVLQARVLLPTIRIAIIRPEIALAAVEC